jgi:hypothetical protein
LYFLELSTDEGEKVKETSLLPNPKLSASIYKVTENVMKYDCY